MGYPISVAAGDGQGDSDFMTQLDSPSPPSPQSPSPAELSSLHRRGLVDVTIGSVNLFMSSPKSSMPKSTEVRVTDLDSQDMDTQNTGPSQALSPTSDSGSESDSQVVSLQGTSTSTPNAPVPVQTHYCQELNASIEVSASQ